MNHRHNLRLLLLASLAALLSACAATQPAAHPVVERAEARWQAVASGDLETAYTFYSPGFRSANSIIDYGVMMRTMKVRWTSAEYLSHDCDENRCTVEFNVGFRVSNPVPGLAVYDGKQIVEDTWIRTQGQWWYVPNN